MNSHFSSLAHELTDAIFSWTSYKEFAALQRTCRCFYLQIHQSKNLKKIFLETWIDTPKLSISTAQDNANFLFRHGGKDVQVQKYQSFKEGACKPCDRKELLHLVRITLKEIIRINYRLSEAIRNHYIIYVWLKNDDVYYPVDKIVGKVRRNWLYKNDLVILQLCHEIIAHKRY